MENAERTSSLNQTDTPVARQGATVMASVQQIYNTIVKPLPPEDRVELMALILGDLAPEPPNTIRSREHLVDLLNEGLRSPTHPVTDDTWEDIRAEVRRRH